MMARVSQHDIHQTRGVGLNSMNISRYGFVFGWWLLLVVIPLAAEEGTHSFKDRLGARLDLAATTGQLEVAGEYIVELSMVTALYEHATFHPLWNKPENVRSLMRWIDRSWEEGLNPEDYHRKALNQVLKLESASLGQEIERELLLTDGLMQLIMHLHTGKADPKRLFKAWNYEPDLRGFPTFDEIITSLQLGRIDELLVEQFPGGTIYPALRQSLAKYREILQRGGWKELTPGTTLHPGDQGERVLQLRVRLHASGDLGTESMGPPDFFDAGLEQAVRRFQRRHLLEDDGIVGRITLTALNVPVEQKIRKIRINMERLRWLNHGIPNEFIGVDLAGFYVFHWKDLDIKWSSAVQVGKPYHQTPIFRDTITYIDINPTWTVPMSITRKELAPRLLKAPLEYLEKHNMELLTPGGRPVDPGQVDWESLSARSFPYVLRQRPGPNNALGRIKFMFPNKYHVYLHDTPSKKLFSRTRRAFSHGCIRVENPLELGELLLAGNHEGWSRARLEEVIRTRETRTVVLRQPMPILIIYLTAAPDMIDPHGLIQFRPDIYHRDEKVLKALDGPVLQKGSKLLDQL